MPVTVPLDLTDVDRAILDELQKGRCTQGFLVDETGYSRNQVHIRLGILAAADHVERIHEATALYQLVDDPRDD